jgi:hypothetical protein
MTQLYVIIKSDRDKFKLQMDSVKKDYENMDKIIKDSVDRALK